MLDAHGTANRAQCATMLQRFLENKTDQTDSASSDSSSSRVELTLPELEAAGALINLVKTQLLASSQEGLRTATGNRCDPCMAMSGHESSFVLKNNKKEYQMVHFTCGYLNNGFNRWNEIRVIGIKDGVEEVLCIDARYWIDPKTYDFCLSDYDEVRFYHLDTFHLHIQKPLWSSMISMSGKN